MRFARGPWVDAIRRYDHSLRVRWSDERKKWAVDAPSLTYDPRWQVPPVKWVIEGGQEKEVLLPADSERRILFKDRRYAVLYSSVLDRRLYDAVSGLDAARIRGNIHQAIRRGIIEKERAKVARTSEDADRIDEGYDRLRFFNRKHWNEGEDFTGVSIKGLKEKERHEYA